MIAAAFFPPILLGIAGLFLLFLIAIWGVIRLLGIRYISHNHVGIVEQLWSGRGSLKDGRIIALNREAGFQADILRGGLHFFYSPLRYRIHRVPLVTVGEGKIGYVYARDGEALTPHQTLGRIVDCNQFQNTRAFFEGGGQRGRQRGILREGVYAINLAQFVVITDETVYLGPIREKHTERYLEWQRELRGYRGFWPVVIGAGHPKDNANDNGKSDEIGVVTVHDGPPLESSEVIAPEVKATDGGTGHACYQEPEEFLALGGHRGKQLQVLTDGTFFINRWFATVEIRPKTLIPVGYVGVVVSYHGIRGEDVTGKQFRYGEQVDTGHRGVWKHALPPGKYPLNPYAMTVEFVPTTNFVLRWITGRTEAHQYDKELKSIELITADGYEPLLPLSLILHIDYEKAPRVVQRFGDVKRLITQTLDPILSAYFRDVVQHINMLELLTKRDEIQQRATRELGVRFQDFDINCIAVMIGRPESIGNQYKPGEDPIEHLFDQLRLRRLAEEQIHTYGKQREAATQLKELKSAEAAAEKEAELTQTRIHIEIAGNRGEAELAEAKRLAERDVVRADGEARSKEISARGEARAKEQIGHGDAVRIAETGNAEAEVFHKKVEAYGDPRLFALQGISEILSGSRQPLVPQHLFMMGGTGPGGENGHGPAGTAGLFNQLVALLLAERADPTGKDGAPSANATAAGASGAQGSMGTARGSGSGMKPGTAKPGGGPSGGTGKSGRSAGGPVD